MSPETTDRTKAVPTMPRNPDIPDEFDVYTVVVLRRPPDAPRLWWVRSGSLAFPLAGRTVGDRRSMPDE